MFSPKVLISILSMLSLSNCELIKFENKSQILCVTDDVNSLIYLNPPLVQKSRNTSILIENDEIWNDWSLKPSTDVLVSRVVDKRWEEFGTIYSDFLYYESAASVSVSVRSGNNITFIAGDPLPLSKETLDSTIEWIHYTSYPPQNHDATDFVKFQPNVTSSTPTYWKLHDYKLRWANTTSETTTILPVSIDDTSCLILYAYICVYCNLKITVQGGSTYELSGTNQQSPEPWQSLRIELESDIDVELFRSTTNGSSAGQWAIDVRKCPPTLANKTIYEVSLDDNVEQGVNWTCALGTPGVKQTNLGGYTSFKTNDDIFSCNPGTLGRECDIQCIEILGEENKYCEQHEICDNSNSESECLCSWGYQEPTCEQLCSGGDWGLSCQNRCSNCELCNATTGECT